MLSIDSKSKDAVVERRLSLLRSYFSTDITVNKYSIFNRDAKDKIIKDLQKKGEIEAVFLLSCKSTYKDIQHIRCFEQELRKTSPRAKLVNFNASAAGICQERRDAGFAAYHIESTGNFQNVLNSLSHILSFVPSYVVVTKNVQSMTTVGGKKNLYA